MVLSSVWISVASMIDSVIMRRLSGASGCAAVAVEDMGVRREGEGAGLNNKQAYYTRKPGPGKAGSPGRRSGPPARPPYNHAMETKLEKRFGFLVADVGRLSGRRFDQLARASLDLTRAQCRVLAYLSHYGEVNGPHGRPARGRADLGGPPARPHGGRRLDRTPPQSRRPPRARAAHDAQAELSLDSARRLGDAVTDEAWPASATPSASS